MKYNLYRLGMLASWAVGLIAVIAADDDRFASLAPALWTLALLCVVVWIKCTFEVADILMKERNRNGS